MEPCNPRWHHRLYVGIQYLLPHHLLSGLMHRMARVRTTWIKDAAIRAFVRHFRVDLSEPLEPDPRAYPSFNAFFTRALRPGARPLPPEPDAVCSPSDGVLSQFGTVTSGRLLQVKGRDYALAELLGGEEEWIAQFQGGAFATVYLSPRDYHRVHMPLAGELRGMLHIPGRLFSVNPITTALVPRLFARNERVACLYETRAGPMAAVLVGAIFVGSIETVWAGEITPARRPRPVRAQDEAVRLARGEEMGRFNMGSTVVLLFPPGRVRWDSTLRPGQRVRMGQRLGTLLPE